MAKFRPLHWLGEGVHHVFHGTTIAHLDLRNRILTAFTLTVIVDLVLTFVVFKLEAGQKGSNINSMWDSFYYTTSQLTTLGSPMNNPVTVPGQAVVLFINIYAATIASTIAGIFGAFFYNVTDKRHKASEAKSPSESS